MVGSLRVAYVMGRYPAVSHTFIMREIQALREAGVGIDTFSIHDSGEKHLLSSADAAEHANTYSVLPLRAGTFVAAHLRAVLARPVRYLTTLVHSVRVGTPGIRGRLWQVFYFAEAIMVWAECRRRGVRHLHAQFAHQAADVAMLVAHFERDRGWSWSIAIHGPVEFIDMSRIRLALKISRARFIVCISDFARSQVLALADQGKWPKVHVVHCGVDPGVFAHDGSTRPLGEQQPAGGQQPVGGEQPTDPEQPIDKEQPIDGELRVLTVGRLVPLKGHQVVVDAIAQLRSRGARARLTVVGDGPSRPSLERLARDHGLGADAVRFTGAVGQATVRELYRQADVFCLASFGEGVPVVLMEAMAMGLPVIATHIAGIPELVEQGVSGILVPPARSDCVVAALEQLARAPERRRAMGRAGRAKVLSEFAIQGSATRLREIFESELGESSSALQSAGRSG